MECLCSIQQELSLISSMAKPGHSGTCCNLSIGKVKTVGLEKFKDILGDMGSLNMKPIQISRDPARKRTEKEEEQEEEEDQ